MSDNEDVCLFLLCFLKTYEALSTENFWCFKHRDRLAMNAWDAQGFLNLIEIYIGNIVEKS